MAVATKARMWCFTLPADEDLGEHITWPLATREVAPIHWADKKNFRYMMYQVERAPTTGKIHLQGFICLTGPLRLGELKTHYGARAHWERSRGTIAQNVEYVSKEESRLCGPFELGTKPEGGAQANKRKWEDVKQMAQQGLTRDQILMDMPHLASQHRGIDALIQATRPQPAISREIEVFYLTGPTGVGKTHHALNRFPNAFVIRGKYMEGKSFDMYNYETTLIMDEWTPFEWPLTLMNTILDKWKCPLTCRYNNKYAFWNSVVITTNVPIDDCYNLCLQMQRDSFRRRVTHIVQVTTRVDALEWGDRPGTPLLAGLPPDTVDVGQTGTPTAALVPIDEDLLDLDSNGSPIYPPSD
nr:MAG: replication associated protein [Arizlama virus]